MPSINLGTHEWAKQKNLASFYYPEVTSTNDVAKKEFSETGKDFALYLTDHQTHGRGRGDNTWSDTGNGEILLSTWCYKTDSTPQPILTPLLGLALYESMFVFDSSLPMHIKAPNDLYIDGGKAAGLLVEVEQKGSENLIFVGLGLNCFGGPSVDVPTSALHDFVPNFVENWAEFCKFVYNQFQIAIDKGMGSTLSEDDCDDLLEALTAADPEAYTKVAPNGDLHTASGVVPWMSL